MRRALTLAAGVALGAGMALAGPGVPGAAWFTGLYERVGRDGAGALDDRVYLAPERGNLRMTACGAADVQLGFDPYGLRENSIVSGRDAGALSCLFHNDGYNRPVITCRSDTGERFTLWPVEPDFRTALLECGG